MTNKISQLLYVLHNRELPLCQEIDDSHQIKFIHK